MPKVKFYFPSGIITPDNSSRVCNEIINKCEIFTAKISNLEAQEQNNNFETYFSVMRSMYWKSNCAVWMYELM